MSIPEKGNILIPVEIQHRELDGKLLLACEIAERGKGAIIGSRVEIHKKIARLPFSLYHAKDALRSSHRILGIIRDRGHLLSLLDEEAIVYHTVVNYQERRLYSSSLSMIDHIFAWGKDSKHVIEDYDGYDGQPISITGNPRVDMLRPELRDFYAGQAEELNKKYGNFLLINSNFGKINHFVESLNLDVNSSENVGSEFTKDSHVHRYEVYQAFRKMLPKLATELSDVPIILRPHPSENEESWNELMKPFKNVKVNYDGNIIPWLLASKATLHNGCTTAVESFLMGKIAYCYQPLEPSRFDLSLPDDLSQKYTDIDQMIAAIKKQIKTGKYNTPTPQQQKLAGRFFSHLSGRLAAEELADELIGCLKGEKKCSTNFFKKSAAFFHAEGRAFVKRMNALSPGHKNSAIFTAHRFPGISLEALEGQIAEYGRLLGRFENIKVKQVEQHIFHLSKE